MVTTLLTLLTIYVLYRICYHHGDHMLIRTLLAILLFPVMPLLLAWNLRRERPFIAWLLVVLWVMWLAVILLMCFIR